MRKEGCQDRLACLAANDMKGRLPSWWLVVRHVTDLSLPLFPPHYLLGSGKTLYLNRDATDPQDTILVSSIPDLTLNRCLEGQLCLAQRTSIPTSQLVGSNN